ncbi:L,D-transpeptidase Cds6 family protein [Variovorax paradoxus]|uniref:Cds6 C-terminal domain-containing protein n=1 Tax=Variovorax paradoxus TaxID=34073 RepID=A0A679JF93_VARPD|nr:hypothetical protein VVAX_06469 [Variovorax paradoxus]
MNRLLTCLLGTGLAATAALAAPATPAPAPAASEFPPSNPAEAIAEVEAVVRAWAAAWSARDVPRYLSAYAPEFTPARGQDRLAWETDRRARIAGKSAIRVDIEKLVISIRGPSASATFWQVYSADKLSERSRKTLELQRVGNRWLIRRESAGG